MVGDYGRSAQLYAALAAANPGDRVVAGRAVAGDFGRRHGARAETGAKHGADPDLGVDARLLLVAEELRKRKEGRGLALLRASGSEPDLSFLAPDSRPGRRPPRRQPGARHACPGPRRQPGRRRVAENRALILLQLGRGADADTLCPACGRHGRRARNRGWRSPTLPRRATSPRPGDGRGPRVATGVGRRTIDAGRPTAGDRHVWQRPMPNCCSGWRSTSTAANSGAADRLGADRAPCRSRQCACSDRSRAAA